MEIDGLLKMLQEWTKKVPLVILGSGSSVPYGLPSMWALGEHLKNTITFPDINDAKQFEQFKDLLDSNGDLERSLSELQLRERVLAEIVSKTWELVNSLDLLAYDKIVSMPDKFPLADLSKYFLATTDRKLSIITTNYDRLAEYAASVVGAFICTGYCQNYYGQFSDRISKNNLKNLSGYSGVANIWKVHGSLDWFKTNQDQDVQLPLRHAIPNNYRPLIVTPGLSKYFETHTEPYRTIFAQADSEIEGANGYLCIGYGFNDIHVQPKLITQIKNHKPIVVITKELTEKAKQSTIGNNCKKYILIEEDVNPKNTKIYSSDFGELTIDNVSYWKLEEYLKIVKS